MFIKEYRYGFRLRRMSIRIQIMPNCVVKRVYDIMKRYTVKKYPLTPPIHIVSGKIKDGVQITINFSKNTFFTKRSNYRLVMKNYGNAKK